MKKLLISLSFASLFLGIVFLNSCTKDDTTPPVITLLGDGSLELSSQYRQLGRSGGQCK